GPSPATACGAHQLYRAPLGRRGPAPRRPAARTTSGYACAQWDASDNSRQARLRFFVAKGSGYPGAAPQVREILTTRGLASRLVPQIIDPIVRGEADVVFGSRLKSGSALAQGMPWWKYFSNRFLTNLENRTFDLSLSEFHTGYRAFRRDVLETVNLALNSDSFIFDQQIVAQIVAAGYRIAEIAVPTRYFPEASSASFTASTVYGLRILSLLARYRLHRHGVWHSPAFDSLRARYTRLQP